MNINNPYQNPYMAYPQNPYPMQQNPYMDRLNNLQQFQQSLQQPQPQPQAPNYLAGKIVDCFDVVKATDVPMDGNIYYFPKADGTEIYTKNWMPNGTTRILTFQPILDSNINSSVPNNENSNIGLYNSLAEAFMKRFDDLEKRLDAMVVPATKSSATRTKKEVDAE